MKNIMFLMILLFSSQGAWAEEDYDPEKFLNDLNAELLLKGEGVTVTSVGNPNSTAMTAATGMVAENWVSALTKNPQDFGVLAVDANGKTIDIFGSTTPMSQINGSLLIPGYDLPSGGKFVTVGAAGYVESAAQLAASIEEVSAPSGSIGKAIDTITAATDYIAQELCKKRSRPTKLVLNLNAGFELVFNATTGSEVEWDLEVVCNRS